MESQSQDTTPGRPRLILLGASNLTRAISTIVECSRQLAGAPLDCYIAMGHGRSFGADATLLGRTLPGILPCALWQALAEAPPAPATFVLLTDVGNDIPYGATPESILEWVAQCLELAGGNGTRLALTQLPMASLATLSRRRYNLIRRLLFPSSDVSYDLAFERIEAVNDGLCDLAQGIGVTPMEMPREWYAPDKIHIKTVCYRVAWPTILHTWKLEAPRPRPRFSLSRYLRCRTARSENVRLLGRDISMAQPARTLPDGTTLHLY